MLAKAAVDKHNAEAALGMHSYTKEVNEFSVMVKYF